MLYKINRDVPANTAVLSPDWRKLHVCKGTIEQWIIFCPDECADLMKFKVMFQGHQILPANRDEWMDALRSPSPIKENLKLDVSPYVLDVYAFNLDDSYSHEYNIYANIIREEPFEVPKSGFDFKASWSKLFGGGG